MNKFGWLSFLMLLLSIGTFFALRGPSGEMVMLALTLFIVFSIAGILFAFFSKKWFVALPAILLNMIPIVYSFFVLIAIGISGV